MALTAGFVLKVFDAASITNAYQDFGTPVSHPAYHMTITNTSDVGVYISTDGTTNDILVPAGVSLVFVAQRPWNPTPNAVYILQKNKQLYIKQVTAAGTGSIIANILTET